MSITNEPTGQHQAAYSDPQYGQPQYAPSQYAQPPMGYPAAVGHGRPLGPVGKIRGT